VSTAIPTRREHPTRRNFLYGATAVVGAAGVAAAIWPFIDQMNPNATTRAVRDFVEVDLGALQPGAQRVARWRNLPVSVVRRTPAMLKALQAPLPGGVHIDASSERRQQPPYARNWHRSIDANVAVLVGACAHCRCVLRFVADDASEPQTPGGHFCPCCASYYDAAGRAYLGPAQFNLAVPPYVIERTTLWIGKNPPGETFSFAELERA
jgi:ubiquinol-cytochrome c reductase iron-sulfur subunit